MNEENPGSPVMKLDLKEILYVLFRHKWKILLLSVMALGAALCVPLVKPKLFESEARLYIRYIVESRNPTQESANDSRIHLPDQRGNSIINTELQILTSMDLAQQVADAVGPEKILGRRDVPNSRLLAGIEVQRGLAAEVPKDSSVVTLTFQHHDPGVVQNVLKTLIQCYFKKHAEIHAVGAFDDFLSSETDQRRSKVAQTEEELRKAKAKLGIISLEDSRQAASAQILRLEQEISDAEAQLAEKRGVLSEAMKFSRSAASVTDSLGATNYFEPVPREKTEQYRQVSALLEDYRKREHELLQTYTASNGMVQAVEAQIATSLATKKDLESAYPGLLAGGIATVKTSGAASGADDVAGVNFDTVQVSGAESRLKALKEQLDQWQKKAAALAQGEATILDLERQLQLQSTNYTRFAQSLEQAQIEERLGEGKVSNISIIEEPTPPLAAPGKRLKMMMMIVLGGLAMAFGTPFLIEFYLDTSVKRAGDVEGRLRLPLFMSVPMLKHGAKLQNGQAAHLLGNGAEAGASEPNGSHSTDLVPWDPRHSLRPFSEGLRDRLINWFEEKQMTHKPKLVGITSCRDGAGVSTIAAGLAASLSDTGEGNVLLVDMNLPSGAAHHFRKGNLACDLDDALEVERRNNAKVQENLYVVSESPEEENVPRLLPKQFKSLITRMKASDFDYIIFDMPPVGQISLTARVAKFMDLMLMVVESEKTDSDVVKRAKTLLGRDSKSGLGIVLNKQRSYVPRVLREEL